MTRSCEHVFFYISGVTLYYFSFLHQWRDFIFIFRRTAVEFRISKIFMNFFWGAIKILQRDETGTLETSVVYPFIAEEFRKSRKSC